MTYAEFKKEHDKLVTRIIFTESKHSDTLVERLERLRLDNEINILNNYGRIYNDRLQNIRRRCKRPTF